MKTARRTNEELHEDHIAQVMGKCAHFTGTQHPTCSAGVAYASVTVDGPNGARAHPCLAKYNTVGATCDKRQAPTRDEAEAVVAERNKGFERTMKARKAIVAATEGKRGLAGVIDCPNCDGKLAYSVAGNNGHIWGNCSTAKCCSWME